MICICGNCPICNENRDLEAMKAKLADIKIKGMEYMFHILTLNEDGLRCSGHKDIPSALLYTAKSIQENVNKLIKAHVRKYPD